MASMYASLSTSNEADGRSTFEPSPFPEHTALIKADRVALAREVFRDGAVGEAVAAKLLEFRAGMATANAILTTCLANEEHKSIQLSWFFSSQSRRSFRTGGPNTFAKRSFDSINQNMVVRTYNIWIMKKWCFCWTKMLFFNPFDAKCHLVRK